MSIAAGAAVFNGDEESRQAYLGLTDWFRSYTKVFVAFSGGADSALVLRAALDGLGSNNVVAVTADSPSLPRSEFAEIRDQVESIGVEWIVLGTKELAHPQYRANTGERCYHCKDSLYSGIEEMAAFPGTVAVDGTNKSDLSDVRPGLRAAREHRIMHPLVDSGFDKSLVRKVSRALGLQTADKPAMACLSSRIPIGTEVTAEKLRRVEQAEAELRALGFKQLRVRYHELSGSKKLLARIELDPSELELAARPENRSRITSSLKGAGFDLVALDLAGYGGGAGEELISLPQPAAAKE